MVREVSGRMTGLGTHPVSFAAFKDKSSANVEPDDFSFISDLKQD